MVFVEQRLLWVSFEIKPEDWQYLNISVILTRVCQCLYWHNCMHWLYIHVAAGSWLNCIHIFISEERKSRTTKHLKLSARTLYNLPKQNWLVESENNYSKEEVSKSQFAFVVSIKTVWKSQPLSLSLPGRFRAELDQTTIGVLPSWSLAQKAHKVALPWLLMTSGAILLLCMHDWQ